MGAQTTLHVIYMDYFQLNSGAYFADCAENKKNEICESSENVTRFMEYTRTLINKNFENIPNEVQKYFS